MGTSRTEQCALRQQRLMMDVHFGSAVDMFQLVFHSFRNLHPKKAPSHTSLPRQWLNRGSCEEMLPHFCRTLKQRAWGCMESLSLLPSGLGLGLLCALGAVCPRRTSFLVDAAAGHGRHP